jgi:hypothetical protein
MENKPESPATVHRLVGQLWELLYNATPGPWVADSPDMAARTIADVGHVDICAPASPFVRASPENDAALIVAAVNSLPALLAIAEAAAVVSPQRNVPYLMAYIDATLKAESDLRAALRLLPNSAIGGNPPIGTDKGDDK